MRLLLKPLAALVLFSATLLAGTEGSFRGVIVADNVHGKKGWISVQGKNHLIRRVNVSEAEIVYDESATAAPKGNAANALIPGNEVRVTAEQDEDGEWRARRVEVLIPVAREMKKAVTSPTPVPQPTSK